MIFFYLAQINIIRIHFHSLIFFHISYITILKNISYFILLKLNLLNIFYKYRTLCQLLALKIIRPLQLIHNGKL